MKILIFPDQLQTFLFAILLGFALGFLYDIFNMPCVLFNLKSSVIFFKDCFYFFCLAIITFLFVLAFNYGEIRFFIMFAETLGFIIYKFTLSNLVIRVFKLIFKLLRKIFYAIKMPIFKILSYPVNIFLRNPLVVAFKKNIFTKYHRKKSKKLLNFNYNLLYNLGRRFLLFKKHKNKNSVSN